MVELVDTRDLKSLGTKYCESSSLSLGTEAPSSKVGFFVPTSSKLRGFRWYAKEYQKDKNLSEIIFLDCAILW